jgi:hypothetical protein
MLRLKTWATVCAFALLTTTGVAAAAGRGGAGLNGGSWQHTAARPTFYHGATHRKGPPYRNYGGRRYGGLYGGYYLGIPASDGYNSIEVVPAPQSLGPVVSPTFALSCHRSQEVITVPTENGGSRKVTITRC